MVEHLRKMPSEQEWFEFKENNDCPEMIGKDISALANSATLKEKSHSYLIWGINDKTHEIVGTTFDWYVSKKGGEVIENWLRTQLSDNAEFEFKSVNINDKRVVILIIQKAINQPIKFQKTAYIRSGSYTKKLDDCPSMQPVLWDKLRSSRFEEGIAKRDLQGNEALSLLDYTTYFDILKIPQPSTMEEIIYRMTEEKILIQQDDSLYGITNLGAILFAKELSNFPSLSRKAVRIIQFEGINRMKILKDETDNKGYVVGFADLIRYVEALTPTQETIEEALREKKNTYPTLAIREMIANALIHQNFFITGTGPIIEIFKNRIEVTNPGIPLIDIVRIIDNPPKSRNERLATLMRRLKICEEAGSGWDKIAISCELYKLPAPRIDIYENTENTKVTIFSKMPFRNLALEDKLWACYLHACIKQVQGEQITNSSLRIRFGLPETSSGSVSRVIKEAINSKLIKPLDPETAPRYMRYVPIWA